MEKPSQMQKLSNWDGVLFSIKTAWNAYEEMVHLLGMRRNEALKESL